MRRTVYGAERFWRICANKFVGVIAEALLLVDRLPGGYMVYMRGEETNARLASR